MELHRNDGIYGDFAAVYDRFMDDTPYENGAGFWKG